jgi:hypothetical protein
MVVVSRASNEAGGRDLNTGARPRVQQLRAGRKEIPDGRKSYWPERVRDPDRHLRIRALKIKNPAAPAVRRGAEEDWGRISSSTERFTHSKLRRSNAKRSEAGNYEGSSFYAARL